MNRFTAVVMIACGTMTVASPGVALAKRLDAVQKQELEDRRGQKRSEKAAAQDEVEEEQARGAAQKARRGAVTGDRRSREDNGDLEDTLDHGAD